MQSLSSQIEIEASGTKKPRVSTNQENGAWPVVHTDTKFYSLSKNCESEKQTLKTKKSPLKNQKITPINQKIIFSIFEPKSWFCLSVHNLSSNPPENAKFD